MKTYQVTLSDESAALVDKMLQDGPWESVDELFLNGIGTLQEDVAPYDDLDLNELQAKLLAADSKAEADAAFCDDEVMQILNNSHLAARS